MWGGEVMLGVIEYVAEGIDSIGCCVVLDAKLSTLSYLKLDSLDATPRLKDGPPVGATTRYWLAPNMRPAEAKALLDAIQPMADRVFEGTTYYDADPAYSAALFGYDSWCTEVRTTDDAQQAIREIDEFMRVECVSASMRRRLAAAEKPWCSVGDEIGVGYESYRVVSVEPGCIHAVSSALGPICLTRQLFDEFVEHGVIEHVRVGEAK